MATHIATHGTVLGIGSIDGGWWEKHTQKGNLMYRYWSCEEDDGWGSEIQLVRWFEGHLSGQEPAAMCSCNVSIRKNWTMFGPWLQIPPQRGSESLGIWDNAGAHCHFLTWNQESSYLKDRLQEGLNQNQADPLKLSTGQGSKENKCMPYLGHKVWDTDDRQSESSGRSRTWNITVVEMDVKTLYPNWKTDLRAILKNL